MLCDDSRDLLGIYLGAGQELGSVPGCAQLQRRLALLLLRSQLGGVLLSLLRGDALGFYEQSLCRHLHKHEYLSLDPQLYGLQRFRSK